MINKEIISGLVILFLPFFIVVAEDSRDVYYYENNCYRIEGITREEGIADAVSAISSDKYALISGHDYANTVLVVAPNEEILSLYKTELGHCYRFPSLSILIIMPGDTLENIQKHGTMAILPGSESALTVCSNEYAAWYNTTVINYAFTRPDILTNHRTTIGEYTSEACFPGYPFAKTGIFELLPSTAATENTIYRYNDNHYEIVGTEKEQGIADALSSIDSQIFALIAEHAFVKAAFIITKDGQVQPVGNTDIADCYEFPFLPVSRAEAMGDEYVAQIRREGTETSAPNTRILKVCSKTYSAWYNTTILNYAFLHRDILTRYRNSSGEHVLESCLPNYPLENVDIFRLWDNSKKAAPGIPDYPW